MRRLVVVIGLVVLFAGYAYGQSPLDAFLSDDIGRNIPMSVMLNEFQYRRTQDAIDRQQRQIDNQRRQIQQMQMEQDMMMGH